MADAIGNVNLAAQSNTYKACWILYMNSLGQQGSIFHWLILLGEIQLTKSLCYDCQFTCLFITDTLCIYRYYQWIFLKICSITINNIVYASSISTQICLNCVLFLLCSILTTKTAYLILLHLICCILAPCMNQNSHLVTTIAWLHECSSCSGSWYLNKLYSPPTRALHSWN